MRCGGRGVVRWWRGRRHQWRGAALATAAAETAANGNATGDGRDRRAAGQQPGWPWTKPSQRALPTSSSRPTPAGAATGASTVPELVRRAQDELTWSRCSTNSQPAGSIVVGALEGPHAYEKHSGISRAFEMKQACIDVNHFLRERFPSQTWTSMVYNPSMPLHRDILSVFLLEPAAFSL